ncbi:MAG: hypothetical protein IEMM0007_2014 [bacterium]|nr:MAG: hypothetical protein IEMM0007_2014 [bacterium]
MLGLMILQQMHDLTDDRSDANALIPMIDATQDKGLGPEEVLADSLYGGDKNCEKAKELGVEIISPVK